MTAFPSGPSAEACVHASRSTASEAPSLSVNVNGALAGLAGTSEVLNWIMVNVYFKIR